jgi:hypothetical protein
MERNGEYRNGDGLPVLMNFPDLPLIPWDVFISRVRIRWTTGSTPESFSNPLGKQRKMKATKPAKKVAGKPVPKKSGKKEKC